METSNGVDDINVMDDPEGGCIVQADDPQMQLANAALDAAGATGNNCSYWTSMLKLMEQAATPSSTHNINSNYSVDANITPAQQQSEDHSALPLSTSSPSSSSVHDQAVDMLAPSNAMNCSESDVSVWAQEFLSGPIGENSSNIQQHLASCSDDGLHELLYPRTVLELLFSDQLKLEQMPSWQDILQHNPGKNFGFPLTSDKITGAPTHENGNMDSIPQIDIKFPQYIQNYSHLSAMDDRLSSSTASSTLSDNAIDQWVPASSAAPCEHTQAPQPAVMQQPSSLSNMQQIDLQTRVKQEYNHISSPPFSHTDNMQQIDLQTRVKQEYNQISSPPFSRAENVSNFSSPYFHQQPQVQRVMGATGAPENGFNGAMMPNHEYEQKPSLINKLWSAALMNPSDSVPHLHHKQHIYESITAANFSHNLRQVASLNSNPYLLQTSHKGIHIPAPGAATSLQNYISHPDAQQLAKKSRPFHEAPDQGGAAGRGGVAAGEVQPTNGREMSVKEESKAGAVDGAEQAANMAALQNMMTNVPAAAGAAAAARRQGSAPPPGYAPKQQQQQTPPAASGAEYNVKRSRTEQTAPPPLSSSSSSSSSFKTPPVRKEKLSERITTLQQLVSPFGKTDTASVLLEAIGYIKFLQDQVQALSSPYFKSPTAQTGDRHHNGDEAKPDLRSRGLCLVPLSCTVHVANDNGADYWYGGTFR